MCQIIDFDSYRPASAASSIRPATHAPSVGSLDTFDAGNGKVGIDACLSAAVADVLGVTSYLRFTHYMTYHAGNMALEAHMPAADAAHFVRRAKRAGVTVN